MFMCMPWHVCDSQSIEKELLQRLQSGTYGDIYNFPVKNYNRVLDAQQLELEDDELDEDEELLEGEDGDGEGRVEYVEDYDDEEEEDMEDMDFSFMRDDRDAFYGADGSDEEEGDDDDDGGDAGDDMEDWGGAGRRIRGKGGASSSAAFGPKGRKKRRNIEIEYEQEDAQLAEETQMQPSVQV